MQALQTKVRYFMQTVLKPYLEWVPQLGQVVLAGRRERDFTAASGVVGMVVVLFCVVVLLMRVRSDGFHG